MTPEDAFRWAQAVELLRADGIELSTEMVSLLGRHIALVREWNPIVGVVSKGDVDLLPERHVMDSLSLAAVVQRFGFGEAQLLDIGSGGGFPAIPLKIVLPLLQVTLVERSSDKMGFLRKCVANLGLKGVQFVHGDFPRDFQRTNPGAITARAVERPADLSKSLLPCLRAGATLFSQSKLAFPDEFEAIPVVDAWSELGLRRSQLHVVRGK